MNYYKYIMTTLRFISLNKKCPKAKALYKYYGNIKSLLLVNICCAFTTKCQRLVELVSIDLMDIISCYAAIRKFRQLVLSIIC